MSVFSDGNNAKLGEVIAHLKTLPQDMVIEDGFGSPHSYRGYYEDLAFKPQKNVTVASMLQAAESALGKTFEGYKGGDFTMHEDTDCWLAEWGDTGVPIVLPGQGAYVLPEAE